MELFVQLIAYSVKVITRAFKTRYELKKTSRVTEAAAL
jgi:hypothetical protein